jgi:hypothetical protein
MAKNWLQGSKDYHNLTNEDSNNWYSYALFDVPWPLNKVDVVLKNSVYVASYNNSIVLKMIGDSGYLPEKKRVSRLSHLEITWVLTPLSNGDTRVTCFIYSEHKSSFSKLIEPIILGKLLDSMISLQTIEVESN